VGRELALGRAARKKGGRGNQAREEKEWAEPESVEGAAAWMHKHVSIPYSEF